MPSRCGILQVEIRAQQNESMAEQGSRYTPMTREQLRVIATLLRSCAHIREVREKVLAGG